MLSIPQNISIMYDYIQNYDYSENLFLRFSTVDLVRILILVCLLVWALLSRKISIDIIDFWFNHLKYKYSKEYRDAELSRLFQEKEEWTIWRLEEIKTLRKQVISALLFLLKYIFVEPLKLVVKSIFTSKQKSDPEDEPIQGTITFEGHKYDIEFLNKRKSTEE